MRNFVSIQSIARAIKMSMKEGKRLAKDSNKRSGKPCLATSSSAEGKVDVDEMVIDQQKK